MSLSQRPNFKIFCLRREEDESGVSGTGVVAVGIIFPNGWCAMGWLTKKSSVAVYKDIKTVKAIHGHDGKTKVVQIVDHDAKRVGDIIHEFVMDNVEGVGCEFGTPNQLRVWKARDQLLHGTDGILIDKDL